MFFARQQTYARIGSQYQTQPPRICDKDQIGTVFAGFRTLSEAFPHGASPDDPKMQEKPIEYESDVKADIADRKVGDIIDDNEQDADLPMMPETKLSGEGLRITGQRSNMSRNRVKFALPYKGKGLIHRATGDRTLTPGRGVLTQGLGILTQGQGISTGLENGTGLIPAGGRIARRDNIARPQPMSNVSSNRILTQIEDQLKKSKKHGAGLLPGAALRKHVLRQLNKKSKKR
jgi:hypothetical protein